MAGLLGNPLLAIGQGLLAAGGPSLDPGAVGLGRGLGLAAGNLSALQQEQMRRQLLSEKLAMEREEMSMRRQQWQAEQEEARRKQDMLERQRAAFRGLLEQVPEERRELARGLLDADQGDAVIKMLTSKPDLPSVAQEYEYAKARGYQGSFEEWKKLGRSNITQTMGTTEKPVGEKARDYVMPDGTSPSPTMTINEIVAGGGRVLNDQDKEFRKREALMRLFDEQVEKRTREHTEALEAFRKSPTAENRRKLNTAQGMLNIAIGQRGNIMGEASDFTAKQVDTPGPADVLLDPLWNRFFGNSAIEPPAPPPIPGQAPQAPTVNPGLLQPQPPPGGRVLPR